MSLQFIDGFEGQDLASFYSSVAQASTGTTTRFSYGRALTFTGTPGTIRRSITASTDVYVGVAYKITATSAINMLEFYSESILHVAIALRADGGIDILRNTTVLASSAAGLIVGGSWNYVEVHVKVADSGGAVEVRLNGGSTAVVSFSGDTKNGGTLTTIAEVLLRGNSGVSFDDLYVCDGLGTTNNNFLGDVRVQTLFPSAAGSSTGMTPSAGSNWQCVDEAPASSVDYVGSTVAGTRDTYNLTDLVAGTANVYGVMLMTNMHKSDAGAASMKPALKSGASNYYGSTRALATSMTAYLDMFETDPATSAAWTTGAVNALEIGAEVV